MRASSHTTTHMHNTHARTHAQPYPCSNDSKNDIHHYLSYLLILEQLSYEIKRNTILNSGMKLFGSCLFPADPALAYTNCNVSSFWFAVSKAVRLFFKIRPLGQWVEFWKDVSKI